MKSYKTDDRESLDLTRQIDDLKQKVHDAELETSLVKAVGMNSPEMKAAKEEINELKNKIASLEDTLTSRDYFEKPDYKYLVNENKKLEEERNELLIDNKRLTQQINDQVNRLRKSGAL